MIDVLVAGAGPVGLATALYAAASGLSVVVHEPRVGVIDKACGEGLMPGGVAALAALGIDPVGVPLGGIRYLDDRHCVEAAFVGGHGRGVRRTTLHAAMLEAVSDAGIEVVARGVDGLSQDADGVQLTGSGPHTRARYLVAADGLHSPTRHRLGLDAPTRGSRRFGLRRHFAVAPWTDHVEVHWSPDAEAYVTPVGPDRVGVALLTSSRQGFTQLLRGFPDLCARLGDPAYGVDRGGGAADSVKGAGPLRQRARRRVAGRVLLVGDASGYVDALTGEGIALGLAQAQAAVEAVRAGAPETYERDWRRVTRRPAALTHGLVAVARTPWTRRRLVPLAAGTPGVFPWAVNALARGGGQQSDAPFRGSVL